MTKSAPSVADPALSGPETLPQRVGNRVRRTREDRRLTRKQVSELSGVSPRYLAQLESGDGNISIALLQKIAVALSMPIEWLVSADDPATSDIHRATELFRRASPTARAQALQVLSADPSTTQKAQRICLIGLRGAGKSSLGAAVGASLSVPFQELNKVIEQNAGMPMSEVMALYGTDGYRALESDALNHVIAENDRVILAVAGGIVADPGTFQTVLDRFHTIWVHASAREHMERVVAQGDMRPISGNPAAMAQLKTILEARSPAYGRAQTRLDTSGRAFGQSVADLKSLIETSGFLG